MDEQKLWSLATHTRVDFDGVNSTRELADKVSPTWEFEPGDMTHYRVIRAGFYVVFHIGMDFFSTTWGVIFAPIPGQPVGDLGQRMEIGTRRPGLGYEYDLAIAEFAARLVTWPEHSFPEPDVLRERRRQ